MSFPKSLQQPFRKNKLVVGAGWRAYFMPYNVALGSAVASTVSGPTIVDLTQGPFDSYYPPFNMADLGWIKNFKLTVGSKIGQVWSGYRGAVRAQYRGQVAESFECQFNEYGRMQYRLATGSNVINLLAATGLSGGTSGPLSASGTQVAPFAANVTAYNAGTPVAWNAPQGTPATLTLATIPQLSQIYPGSYIAVDQDYTLGLYGGAVGDSGVNVYQGAVTDIDYLRKNTDFVARVTAINGNVLTLDQPFVGGGSGNPTPNFVNNQFTSFVSPQVRAVPIKGFVAREGGTFIGEWSGLFLNNTVDGAQLVIYYPHVSISQNKDVAAPWTIENAGTTDESGFQLDAAFNALAFDDPLDGETVVAYKAYYYKPGEAAAI
jgi:hypothetical protein